MQLITPAQEVPVAPLPWSRHTRPSSQTSREVTLLRTVVMTWGLLERSGLAHRPAAQLSSPRMLLQRYAGSGCRDSGTSGGLWELESRAFSFSLSCCITSHTDLGVSDNSIHHTPKPFQRATRVRQEAERVRLRNNTSRWMPWRQGNERDQPSFSSRLSPPPPPPTGLYFSNFDTDD